MHTDGREERTQLLLREEPRLGCHRIHAPRLDPRAEGHALSVVISLLPVVPCGTVDLTAVVQVGLVPGIVRIDLLGGAVGGSRVATNLGWRPHSDQIGQTGTRIAPDLYIACGISGAIQHMVGCKGAKHILVINQDAEAPIFERADYAVIGDLHEIIPALVNELRKEKAG